MVALPWQLTGYEVLYRHHESMFTRSQLVSYYQYHIMIQVGLEYWVSAAVMVSFKP